ncbi:MAG: tryptophan 2,3-dioxygenase [Arenimonas sp.]|nr:tryptophan 2,3-dioxygenase [Arenimonas sp.]MBP6310508.1 tryptophan 2,3-dioxygenase [Arenimonas sp.]
MENVPNQRPLEATITTDFKERMSYGGYLRLDKLLDAQHPLSAPVVHDEMLFIIQHQTSELWMKLVIHELTAAMAFLRQDDLGPCQKMLARIKHIQKQLTEQWSVLETLTPSDYMKFRDVLGSSSGFQSQQYREIEFLLGNKNAHYVKMFDYDENLQRHLETVLNAPSLYDEFLRHLARKGHAIPAQCLNHDWSQPYQSNEQVVLVFEKIYENTEANWDAYHFCEQLVDIEVNFQQWRFRHLKTVERIIGYKPGTGGSSGVAFLKKALDLSFFPELFEVRTRIG